MTEKRLISEFEILIDDFFLNLKPDTPLKSIEKKKVLSIINDFEDGEWRYSKFQSFIWNNITETSLSFKDRLALIDKPMDILIESAKKLRITDLDKGGRGSELAEIILYGIMKHHYGALPAVPKIYYKQNSQDNAKGADSVHIVEEANNEFSIWMGEAKFYNSIEDSRLHSIVDSVEESLKTDKLKKENSIITSISDLKLLLKDNLALYDKIQSFICTDASIDALKPKLHIPILILHECSITSGKVQLSDQYKSEIIDFHKERAESYFKKQINKLESRIFKYSEIHFHLILFPIPKKETIITEFINRTQTLKSFK